MMAILCALLFVYMYAPWLFWAVPLLLTVIAIINACRAEKQRREEEAARQAREAEKSRKAAEAAAVKAAKEEERRQKAAEKSRKAAEAAERRRIAEERRREREAEKARKAEAQAAKPAKTQRAQAIPESALSSGTQPFAGEMVAFTGENPKMTTAI